MNTTGEYPDYSVASVLTGDVVRIDGNPTPTTVERAWWDSPATAHRLVLADGRDLTVPRDDRTRNRCTLVARPGIDNLHHEYQTGDRVTLLRTAIVGGPDTTVGVVEEVHRHAPGPDGVAYEVRTVVGGLTAAGPDRLNPDPTPMPAPGQVWICPDRHRFLRVTSVDTDQHPSGLVAHGFMLAAPHWRIATAAEMAAAEPVYVSVSRKGINFHRVDSFTATTTACERSTRSGEIRDRVEVVESLKSQPCPRCYPLITSKPDAADVLHHPVKVWECATIAPTSAAAPVVSDWALFDVDA